MYRIMLVEDDEIIARSIKQHLVIYALNDFLITRFSHG